MESEAYMTYHAYDIGEKTPKPKYTKKKADSVSSLKMKSLLGTDISQKDEKPSKKEQKGTRDKKTCVERRSPIKKQGLIMKFGNCICKRRKRGKRIMKRQKCRGAFLCSKASNIPLINLHPLSAQPNLDNPLSANTKTKKPSPVLLHTLPANYIIHPTNHPSCINAKLESPFPMHFRMAELFQRSSKENQRLGFALDFLTN
ncbi:hypothetical protein Tco_0271636 [Tanacetum coccineum]